MSIPKRHNNFASVPPDFAAALASELATTTTAEVRFDDGARAAWSTDASNYRHVPIGVVLPRTIDDVIQTVALCRKYGAPITVARRRHVARRAGVQRRRDHRHVEVPHARARDRSGQQRTARVEPGCILDDLRDQATRAHGLTFGPDPATHNRNTLGGMIGNNSCGVHSVMSQFYGPGPLTRHQVIELDVLTYDGERFTVGATSDAEYEAIIADGGRRGAIYEGLRELRDTHAVEIRERFVNIPRRVSGYNLDALLPEHDFNVAHAARRHRGGNVRNRARRHSHAHSRYASPHAAGARLPRCVSGRRSCIADHGASAGGARGIRRRTGGDDAKAPLAPRPGGDAAGWRRSWLLVEFGGESTRRR